jgi:nucleoside-diphosphate-sugar epimerase
MSRVLITGASGFIGSHLTAFLKNQLHTVIPMPRDVFLDPRHLEPFVKGTQPDVIIHLASYGNMTHQQDDPEMVSVNLAGTFNLLQASKEVPYDAFINVSSSSVLLEHETMYSATKAGAERLCRAFVHEYNKPIVTLRPFSVYGEHEADFRFIPTVFRSCLSGEEMTLAPDPVHDWIYIDDFVKAIWDCAKEAENVQGKSLDIGTGIATTNQVVVDLIEKITGKKAKIKIQDSLRPFDSGEWRADAPWDKNMVSLEDGLKRYYKWYTKDRNGGD